MYGNHNPFVDYFHYKRLFKWD